LALDIPFISLHIGASKFRGGCAPECGGGIDLFPSQILDEANYARISERAIRPYQIVAINVR
jgi:hypothetical protein